MNESMKTLLERRSIRKYTEEQVDEATLDQILKAGTYAPSCMGKQSAVMVVIRDKETLKTLSAINAEIQGNPTGNPFYGAPTAVLVLADSATPCPVQDAALVLGNLMNAAYALGVSSCWINRAKETFERPEGKELLKKWGLPETLVAVGYCILGYADGPAPEPKPRKEGYIVRV